MMVEGEEECYLITEPQGRCGDGGVQGDGLGAGRIDGW